MGKPEYFVAADYWVRTLRQWQSFDGDIILFVDDNASVSSFLRRQVELHSLTPAREAAKSFATMRRARGNIFMHKPFILRHALESLPHDMIMMADIDALAVRPVEPMFEAAATAQKVFVSHGMDKIYSMVESDAHRGFFTSPERHQFDQMGLSPACAGFTLGPSAAMKTMVDSWIDILATKRYRKDGRPGLQEQSALNYWLFKNPELWTLMPAWIRPFDGPSWQRADGGVLIWHFYGYGLKRHREAFKFHNKGRRNW